MGYGTVIVRKSQTADFDEDAVAVRFLQQKIIPVNIQRVVDHAFENTVVHNKASRTGEGMKAVGGVAYESMRFFVVCKQ